jgi:transposase-like protein
MNNIVEQDHRFIKRRVKPGLRFFSYPTAWRTLQGYETMNMIPLANSIMQERDVMLQNERPEYALVFCL